MADDPSKLRLVQKLEPFDESSAEQEQTHQDLATDLYLGTQSDAVRNLQLHLGGWGFDPGEYTGTYTKKTSDAVKSLQQVLGSRVTGHYDERTRKAVMEDLAMGGSSVLRQRAAKTQEATAPSAPSVPPPTATTNIWSGPQRVTTPAVLPTTTATPVTPETPAEPMSPIMRILLYVGAGIGVVWMLKSLETKGGETVISGAEDLDLEVDDEDDDDWEPPKPKKKRKKKAHRKLAPLGNAPVEDAVVEKVVEKVVAPEVVVPRAAAAEETTELPPPAEPLAASAEPPKPRRPRKPRAVKAAEAIVDTVAV